MYWFRQERLVTSTPSVSEKWQLGFIFKSGKISFKWNVRCRRLPELGVLLSQQAQTIADNQQAGPHICKHRHPHRPTTCKRQAQKNRLDIQCEHDVLNQ